MMHYYDGWEQHQHAMLDNHWYYPHYVDEVYAYRHRIERMEDDGDHTADETRDTITSATSSEIFRLEFAASQWSKLVSNAEGLFHKLILSNLLPHNEQDQIEQWLCMKQEYEECISNDCHQGFENIAPDPRRSLERIEEESDENFHRPEFENCSESCSGMESEMSEEEEEQSDTESESPDFLEKLDNYMLKFKEETDRLVDSRKDVFSEMKTDPVPMVPRLINNNNELGPIIKPIPIRNTNSRRNSILPGSEMCNELMAFNDSLKNYQNQNYQYDMFDRYKSMQGTSNVPNRDIELQHISEEDHLGLNSAYLAFQKDNSPDILVDALKNVEICEPVKTIKTFNSKAESKQSHVKQIQTDPTDIRSDLKESCSVSETKLGIKQRFQSKKNKNEEPAKDSKEMCVKKKYDNNKNEDTDSITSEKKSTDSKKIKQLKKEEQCKKQKESKHNKHSSKNSMTAKIPRELHSDSEDEHCNSNSKSSKKDKEAAKMNAIMNHLDNTFKDKFTIIKRTAGEIEDLRNEIRNLRKTRNNLIDEKCALEEKCKIEGSLSNDERRTLLECAEVIEVIDAVIERKNEMICGRKDFDEKRALAEKGLQILMKRLSKLTDGEIKTLFYKYFLKVIDLKESGKLLERQLEEVDAFYKAKFQEYRIAIQKKVTQFLQYPYLQVASKNNGMSEHDKLKFSKYKKEIRDLRQQLANMTALFKGTVVPRTTSPPRVPRHELKQIGNSNGATTTITMERNKMVIRRTMNDKVKK